MINMLPAYGNDDARKPFFPHSAFININHLGLSTKSRFDSKQRYIRHLCKDNDFIGIQELHVSSARAQDAFFDHFTDFHCLYNCAARQPGQCIMIRKQFIDHKQLSSLYDFNSLHHLIFIPAVAHGVWCKEQGAIKLLVNVYLDSHSAATRRNQLLELTRKLKLFRECLNAIRSIFLLLRVGPYFLLCASSNT